jgi:PH (Pleckstrin Homology) domain-containing protein
VLRCQYGHVASKPAKTSVIIKISPMAHLAVGFLALGVLALVLAKPAVFAPLLLIPVVASIAIVRYRTVADERNVTGRYLLSSHTEAWTDVDGLRFDKGSWAKAQLKNGSDMRLPAVTFATLPQLTAATEGRVPNPYE